MYKALYRKYRPITFQDVVGQNVIVKTLKNSITNHTFGHAYMFFGTRGVGKTTISKIFARSINCLEPHDGECCCQCENCMSSLDNECMDIIEIDAASNNGVDEIRNLRNKVMLVPSKLKYKVYIVDEVHMLSIGAFNALLKTLEEPPEHVVFILATTDPQKVPETIISRCQCFSFKKIANLDIVERLKFICKKEKLIVDEKVLESIALYSDGGMRDALSLLDKLISYGNGKIDIDDFYELNDMLSEKQVVSLCDSIFFYNIPEFLEKISKINTTNKNIINVFSQMMYYLHDNVIIPYYTDNKKEHNYDEEVIEKFVYQLSEKMFDFKKSSEPQIIIEIFILNFMNQNMKKLDNKIISREIISDQKEIKNSEFIENNKANKDEKNRLIPENIDEIMKIRSNNILVDADKKILLDEQENFLKFKNYTFDQENGYIACALLDANIRAASKYGIIISYEYDSNVLKNYAILDKMTDFYKKILKKERKISIVSDEVWIKMRGEYIKNIKNGTKINYIDEPAEIFEELEKSDILTNEAIDLFSDIVEVEN